MLSNASNSELQTVPEREQCVPKPNKKGYIGRYVRPITRCHSSSQTTQTSRFYIRLGALFVVNAKYN